LSKPENVLLAGLFINKQKKNKTKEKTKKNCKIPLHAIVVSVKLFIENFNS